MIYGKQNIFDLGVECIVNTVNCRVDVLYERQRKSPNFFKSAQRGLAEQFEKRYPGSQPPLITACALSYGEKGKMLPGSVQLVKANRATGEKDPSGDIFVAHVATKDHWNDPSKLEWVRLGAVKLANRVQARGIRSIAIPPLGADKGKLPWELVQKEIHEAFAPLAAAGVEVYVLGPDALGLSGTTPEPFFYAGIGSRVMWDNKEDIPMPVLNNDGTIKTHSEAQRRAMELGMILAARGGTLRSGAAVGSDQAFEFGADFMLGKKEIYLPKEGFQKRYSSEPGVIAGNLTEKHMEIAARFHPSWDKLKPWHKPLMARNASQCLGEHLERPSDIIVCYTPNGKEKGGTGQSMRMGAGLDIPVLNINADPWKNMEVLDLADCIVRIARKETTYDQEIQNLNMEPSGQLGLGI